MANPMVEKLQTFGIRHGEKVGVAVVSTLCLLMIWTAISRPMISTTPEEIMRDSSAARQNLDKQQDLKQIIEKIQADGIAQPGFEKIVDNRKPGSADASKFQLANLLEAPEPGAGLLREQPDLTAPTKLEIHPGRGSIRLFVLDEKGNVKTQPIKTDEPKQSKKKSSGRGGMAGMMGGMGQNMGGMAGRGETGKEKSESEKKKEEAKKKREMDRLIAGDASAGKVEEKVEEEEVDDNLPPGHEYVKSPKGFRWVVLTGVLDNRILRDNYARALKLDPSGAFVHYLRVDLQRRQRQDDGKWTDWEMVDRQFSIDEVLSLLTELEPETTSDSKLIVQAKTKLKELCDDLPFLEAGYWMGVYHGDAINPEILKTKDTSTTKGAGGGLAGGNQLGGDEGMMAGRGGMGRGGGAGRMPGGAMAGGGGAAGSGGMGGMGGMLGGMSAGEGGGGFGGFFGGSVDKDTNFTKSDSDKLMVRVLDFTVQPGTSYQYRARIVVQNPNYGIENIMPGVDNSTKELTGPWSDATITVAVPPDVQTYVKGPSTPAIRARQPNAVTFGVVRWNQADGYTVVKPFDEGVGEMIGEMDTAAIPVEDKGKTQLRSRSIDFNSNRLLVDASGGSVPIDRLKISAPGFVLPATALILRGDGRIELRDEASDQVSGELAEMEAIYRQTQKDVESGEKKTSNAFGGSGMMGGGMLGAGGAN